MGDKVFIRMTLFRNMMRFERKGKLGPRCIDLYEIVECVGKVSYRLPLPVSINYIHDLFHVSLLHKYISDFFMC